MARNMGISKSLNNAISSYLILAPSPLKCFKLPIVHTIKAIQLGLSSWKLIRGKVSIDDYLTDITSSIILQQLNKPTSFYIKKACSIKTTDRTWFSYTKDVGMNNRAVKPVVVIYHDANRAGKHIDIHIGRYSFIQRVSGKPIEKKITYYNGNLTQESKDEILDFLRKEISNNSRFVQNLDHSITNSKMSWKYNPDLSKVIGYGAGPTRQIVAQSKAEFYHPDLTNSLHIYCPLFNKHQGTYLYRIKQDGVPVVIWGNLIPRDRKFEDRLHLQMTTDINKKDIDISSCTEKIDGASCYLTGNGEGIKVFSPRISKETGHRIEYTYKVPQIAMLHTPDFTGMGELVFERNSKRLSAAQIGGILNSDDILPLKYSPRIYLYRIDSLNGKNTHLLPFWDNRNIQYDIIQGRLSIVPLSFMWFTKLFNLEGNVFARINQPISEGYKIKWLGDEIDMIIKDINLSISKKGNIQGTITAEYNNKQYFFGPGQIGSFDRNMMIIDNPNKYINSTIKVVSRRGGVARAAKVLDFHLDK